MKRSTLLAISGFFLLVGNSVAIVGQTAASFEKQATLDVGLNPHQIWFSDDGQRAYVAAAGSNSITVVAVQEPKILDSIPVAQTPLGVVPISGGDELMVSRFGGQDVVRINLQGNILGEIETGGGTSLFHGPLPNGHVLISSEQTNRLWILDPEEFEPVRFYETGNRPFPPATSSDGTTAFVPNYDDGNVTVIDLANERILETVPVGKNPSGGVFLPEEESYAVAVRGENRIAFLDLHSRRVLFELSEGIGDSPFSVVLSPDRRFAFVNNTASHDVSVIRLPDRRVIQRISTGDIPIVMAVSGDSKSLWVACEGTDQLDIFSLPPF